MGQKGSSYRVFALCVTTACVNLLAACGHDDGGEPEGSVPTATWARTYGGTSADVAESITPTADGGYIVAGSTSSFGAGDTDAWVLKLDAKGNVLWQKTYGGAGQDTASAVQSTADGGYVIAGYTASFGVGGTDAWVVKVDVNGAIPGCTVMASSGATSVAGSATEFDTDTLVIPNNVSLANHTAVSAESAAVAPEQCRNEQIAPPNLATVSTSPKRRPISLARVMAVLAVELVRQQSSFGQRT